jgi:diaminopimelate decarboxylase
VAKESFKLPHEGFKVNSLGHLTLDGYDLVELAERFGTPLFVCSEQRIRRNYRRVAEVFRKNYPGETVIAYAVKANYTLAVMRILALEGAWAEVFSGPELRMALLAGFKPENLILTGCGRPQRDFKEALKMGVKLIAVNSLSELRRLNSVAGEVKVKAKILIRVNPAINVPTHPRIATGVRGTKFGVDLPSGLALKAYEEALAMDWIEVEGIHTHIGSQIMKVEPFLEAARKIADFVGELNSKLGFEPKYLDFGGGLGIPYRREDFGNPLNIETLSENLAETVTEKFRSLSLNLPTLIFEFGRILVGDAEILLSKVGSIKDSPTGKYVFLDASTNLILPILLIDQHYEIILANKAENKLEETVNFAGPLCFTGDVLAFNRRIPKVEEGDVAAILNAGAYCKSACSTHNAYPRPPTLMLFEDDVELVQREETLGDIAARDLIPPRLYRR